MIQAIQQENVQAAAGKIGGRAGPHRAGLRAARSRSRGGWRRSSEFEEIIVRRNDDGSIVRLKDVARVELVSENYETAGYLDGKPAGAHPDLPVRRRQRPGHRPAGPRGDGPAQGELPGGPRLPIAYDTTDYVDENIKEVEHTLIEAFVLVMIVVFVFLQGFRATIIPMLAIPVSLVATFAMMAAFGFSINSLTLCGLVLAIGLVVDDAIIVVENVEKFLHRGLRAAGGDPGGDGRDHDADRDDHPGAGRRVRPGGVHARA